MSEINSYKIEQENVVQENESKYDLAMLESALSSAVNIEMVKSSIASFLEDNDVNPEVKNQLLRVVNNLSDNTSVEVAIAYLNDIIQIEDSIQNKTPEMEELEKYGYSYEDAVELTKNYNINQKSDPLFNAIVGDSILPLNNETDIINQINDLSEIRFRDENGEIQNNQNMFVNYSELVSFNDNGTITIDCNYGIDPNMSFSSYMIDTILLEDKTNQINMQLVNDTNSDNSYKIIFTSYDGFYQNQEVINRVNNAISNYKPAMDYRNYLNATTPEVGLSLELASRSIQNNSNYFQLVINNTQTGHNIAFSFDNNFSDLLTSFQQSGANPAISQEEIVYVNMVDMDNLEQRVILDSTVENLKQITEEKEQTNNNNYQKTIGTRKNETARVAGNLLIIVIVAELFALTIGAYFIFR